MCTPAIFRARAADIIEGLDFDAASRKAAAILLSAPTDDEDGFDLVHDNLSSLADLCKDEGTLLIEDADCSAAEWAGRDMVGAGRAVSRLADEAGREHERRKIADRLRATMTCPASEVMAALAWDAASRVRPAA